MISRTLALAGILGLLLLQCLWLGVIAPAGPGSAWLYVAVMCVPMLPSLVLLLRGHRSALLVGAIAALLYFCHGVMTAMSEPEVRGLGLVEVGLSVLVVVAASWNGMRARFAPKPAV